MQYNVKNAFVYANINADIYTILPIGVYNDPKCRGKVCHLNKAIYGLKQSPRLWYKYLTKVLKGLDFHVLMMKVYL
jgi:hypothetical protein